MDDHAAWERVERGEKVRGRGVPAVTPVEKARAAAHEVRLAAKLQEECDLTEKRVEQITQEREGAADLAAGMSLLTMGDAVQLQEQIESQAFAAEAIERDRRRLEHDTRAERRRVEAAKRGLAAEADKLKQQRQAAAKLDQQRQATAGQEREQLEAKWRRVEVEQQRVAAEAAELEVEQRRVAAEQAEQRRVEAEVTCGFGLSSPDDEYFFGQSHVSGDGAEAGAPPHSVSHSDNNATHGEVMQLGTSTFTFPPIIAPVLVNNKRCSPDDGGGCRNNHCLKIPGLKNRRNKAGTWGENNQQRHFHCPNEGCACAFGGTNAFNKVKGKNQLNVHPEKCKFR